MIDPKLTTEKAGEEPFLHSVKTPLTDKEMLVYTDALTAVDTKEQALLGDFESQKTTYKSEQAKLDSEKGRLMHLLKTKEEYKDVECYNDFDYKEGICTIKRKDNNKTVSTRKMNADEFKRALPFEIKKGVDKKLKEVGGGGNAA